MNQVKLEGKLTHDATYRHTPAGDLIVSLDVRTPLGDGTEASVPVEWFVPITSPAPSLAPYHEGAPVRVEGYVRRRYSAMTGNTLAVTEVVTEEVERVY